MNISPRPPQMSATCESWLTGNNDPCPFKLDIDDDTNAVLAHVEAHIDETGHTVTIHATQNIEATPHIHASPN